MFALLSLGELGAVLAGGLAGGTTTYWLWGVAIFLDLIAALAVEEVGEWDLHPDHFAERHGLFVIIALGESLIVAAGGFLGAKVTAELIAVGTLAVAATCALWWTYFGSAKPALDAALEEATGSARTSLARDAYSMLHFVMILGIIGFAVGIEAAILHPSDPMPWEAGLALGLGVALFAGGLALALWRGLGKLPLFRTAVALATAIGIAATALVTPVLALGMALVGAMIIAVVEHRRRPSVCTVDF